MPIGTRGTLGIGKETTWGSVQVATKYLSMISESITENIEQILSAAHRGLVDEPLSLAGLKTVIGDVVVEVHPANFGDVLRSAIGAPTGPVAVGAAVNLLHDCEFAWVGHENIISTTDINDKKKGSASVKLLVPDGVADETFLATIDFQVIGTDIAFNDNAVGDDTITTVGGNFFAAAFIAGKDIVVTGSAQNSATYEIKSVTEKQINLANGSLTATEAATPEITIKSVIDMTADNQIKLWIKSSIDMVAADLAFVISETAACADGTQKEEEISILSAGEWKEVTIAIDTMGAYDEVISIGVRLKNPKDEFTLWIDDIRRIDTDAAEAHAQRFIFEPRQDDFADGDGVKRCPLCPYTLELFRDNAPDKTFQYRGAQVNTLALNFSTTDKILKATCGIIAKTAHVDITKAGGINFPTTNPFVWDNAIILTGPGDHTVADETINEIESFGINLDNHLVGIASLDGNDVIKRIYRDAAREININFIIDFVNQTQYDLFAAQDERAFQIKFSGARVHDDDATPYSLQIDMPLVRYTVYPPYNISGSGRITAAVSAKAKYDTTLEYAILFTLINVEASYN